MKSNSNETNRIKEPSKFAIKFANIVFVLGILFSVLVTLYAVYKIYQKHEVITLTFYYSYFLFAILTAILFSLGLRKLRDELKVKMSVLFITGVISVYSFEIFLTYLPKKSPEQLAAEQMGVPYDTRTKMEVIDDLVDSGINANLHIAPVQFIGTNGLKTVKGRIYALGGISNITTTLTNESGYYPIIETDEHGFNNPKGLYQINKVDIALIGDSFTEGYSVHSDETISAVLRESGFNSIGLGIGGNGPLIEFATLKEYAEPLKPKIVLWINDKFDLDNMNSELASSFLQKYLNEHDFSQNLLSRQEEIDSLLVDYAVGQKRGCDTYEICRKMELGRDRITSIIRLGNLRRRINLLPTLKPLPLTPPIFKDILQKSKQMVSEWGGEMYFVYLPSWERYSMPGTDKKADVIREFVMRTATKLGLPIIDIHKEVFDPHSDPLSLFALRLRGHYNAEGYKLVAEAISKRLKADGIIPLNSKI